MTFAAHIERIDRAVQGNLGGVAVTYRPEHEDSIEVTGMFDAQYTLVDPGEAGVSTVGPALFLRLADLPIHPEEDNPIITIGETDYDVTDRKLDGQGGILLILHRVE